MKDFLCKMLRKDSIPIKQQERAELESKLEILSDGKILSYNFDLSYHKIKFNILININNDVKIYDIEFYKVSCFYFLNDTTENRLNIKKIDKFREFLECTSVRRLHPIMIYMESKTDTWLSEQFIGSGNIVIKMSENILIIEAQKIRINKDMFDL